MNELEKDKLWQLLGQTPPPAAPGPFFARNVLREIRRREEARHAAPWPLRLLRRLAAPRPLAFAGGGALAVAVLLAFSPLLHSPSTPSVVSAPSSVPQPVSPPPAEILLAMNDDDVSVVADLDQLLASSENQIWLDEPPPDVF